MAGIWYRVGTVALTNGSKRVTGTGTSWLNQATGPIKGNIFLGPDNRQYEIDGVLSNTTLDLVEMYAGSSASGQVYRIVTPIKGTVAALASQVTATLQYAQGQYGNISNWATSDLPMDVPVILPDGVSSKNVPNWAKVLALISERFGPTNKPRAADITGVVGAVSGGAIIERGSNTNGDYVRFADGTQICTRVRVVNVIVPAGTQQNASVEVSAAFVGTPSVAYNMQFFEGTNGSGLGVYGFPSTSGRFVNSGNTYALSFKWPPEIGTVTANSLVQTTLAVGRWF